VFLPLPLLLDGMRLHLDRLVDATAWKRIESLSAALPPVWDAGCFEIRLGAGCGQVDFQVCAHGAAGRQALAQALASGHPLPGGESARPQIQEWIGPETEIARRSPVLWLEYDLPGDEVRPPVLFFGGFGPLASARVPRPGEIRRWMKRWLDLAAPPPDENRLDLLEHCLRALPRGSLPRFLATLRPARASDDLRLVAGLPTPGIGDWLREIGWPGEPRRLEWALEARGGFPEAQVHVDVGESIRPGLGIELTASPSLWPRFIQRLGALGLCDERGTAVLDWLGRDKILPPGARWPSAVDRRVMVKLVLDCEGALSAKAYLIFQAGYTLS